MFTLKELNLMRKMCDEIDKSYFNTHEEKRVYELRHKICDLITLKKAWNKGKRIEEESDFLV